MSIELMSTIFAIKDQLTPSEKLLLLELADHANDQGGGIWPGMSTIVDRTSLGLTTVRDLLRFLTDAGILDTVEEPTPDSSTKRQVNVRMLKEMREFGARGECHPEFAAARARQEAELAQKRAEKEARKAAKEGGEVRPPEGVRSPEEVRPPQGGGAVTAPGGYGDRRGEVRSPHLGGTATGPESLINHNLNTKEPQGILSAREEKKSPSGLGAGELWEMIAGQLRMEMRQSEYNTWVAAIRARHCKDGVFLLAIPNAMGRDWVISRLGKQIENLAIAITGQPLRLVIEVRPAD